MFAGGRYRFAAPQGGAALAGAALGAFALAWLTWRFVEQPVRDRARVSRAAVFGGALGVGIALIVAGRVIDIRHGLPGRLPDYKTAEDSVGAYRHPCLDLEAPVAKTLADAAACRLGVRDAAPDFLLLGDSHAAALADGVDIAARAAGRSGLLLSANGCLPILDVAGYHPPSREACRWRHDNLIGLVETLHIRLVVLHARWEAFDEGPKRDDGAPADVEELAALLKRTLEGIARAGAKIVIVTGTPSSQEQVPESLQRKARFGLDIDPGGDLATFFRQNRTAFRLFADPAVRGAAKTIDLYPSFCDLDGARHCRVSEGTEPYLFDRDHLSRQGAARLAPRLAEIFGP